MFILCCHAYPLRHHSIPFPPLPLPILSFPHPTPPHPTPPLEGRKHRYGAKIPPKGIFPPSENVCGPFWMPKPETPPAPTQLGTLAPSNKQLTKRKVKAQINSFFAVHCVLLVMSVLNPLHQGTNAGSTGSSFSAMFGGEKPSTAQAIQTKLSSAATQVAAGEVPTFTEESAFHKCCPSLTYKQVPIS